MTRINLHCYSCGAKVWGKMSRPIFLGKVQQQGWTEIKLAPNQKTARGRCPKCRILLIGAVRGIDGKTTE